MNDAQINKAIVRFEAAILANAPEWNTREEFMAYEAWMQERMAISKQFKAALVANDKAAANAIIAQVTNKYAVAF